MPHCSSHGRAGPLNQASRPAATTHRSFQHLAWPSYIQPPDLHTHILFNTPSIHPQPGAGRSPTPRERKTQLTKQGNIQHYLTYSSSMHMGRRFHERARQTKQYAHEMGHGHSSHGSGLDFSTKKGGRQAARRVGLGWMDFQIINW